MVAGSSPAGCAIWRSGKSKQMQYGGRSSVGRAQDCGSWCRGFDSHRPPHIPENARPSLAFSFPYRADVVKLVDTLDLGSSAARCESSSLSFRTKFWTNTINQRKLVFLCLKFMSVSRFLFVWNWRCHGKYVAWVDWTFWTDDRWTAWIEHRSSGYNYAIW